MLTILFLYHFLVSVKITDLLNFLLKFVKLYKFTFNVNRLVNEKSVLRKYLRVDLIGKLKH